MVLGGTFLPKYWVYVRRVTSNPGQGEVRPGTVLTHVPQRRIPITIDPRGKLKPPGEVREVRGFR